MLGLLEKFPGIPGGKQAEQGFVDEARNFFWSGYKNGVHGVDTVTIATSYSYGAQYIARLGTCVSRALSPLADLSTMGAALNQVDWFIDGTRVFDDAEYFFFSDALMYDLKHGIWSWLGMRSCFTVADIACALSFADSVGVVDTAEWAAKLGSVTLLGCSIFCPVTSVALGTIALTAGTVGYLCMGVDCAIRIHRGEDSRMTMILTARSAIELFYKIFKLSGAAVVCGTAVTGVIGAGAAVLAIAAVHEQLTGPGRPPMPQPNAEHWVKRWIWV